MKPVAQQEIREISFQLLKETFEGPAPEGASAFLNKGTGLFQTLDEIGADALPLLSSNAIDVHEAMAVEKRESLHSREIKNHAEFVTVSFNCLRPTSDDRY